jgi:hypothetical protein
MRDYNKNNWGLPFWVHFLFLVLFLSSPFLFRWYVILLGGVLIGLQFFILDDCVFTKWEFGEKTEDRPGFFEHYLAKIGIKISAKTGSRIVRHYFPLITFVLVIVWQFILGYGVLIF